MPSWMLNNEDSIIYLCFCKVYSFTISEHQTYEDQQVFSRLGNHDKVFIGVFTDGEVEVCVLGHVYIFVYSSIVFSLPGLSPGLRVTYERWRKWDQFNDI